MPWHNGHIWFPKRFLDDDYFTGVIPFDGMADELQDVPANEKPQADTPPTGDRHSDRHDGHGDADGVKGQAAGMPMSFQPVLNETLHVASFRD